MPPGKVGGKGIYVGRKTIKFPYRSAEQLVSKIFTLLKTEGTIKIKNDSTHAQLDKNGWRFTFSSNYSVEKGMSVHVKVISVSTAKRWLCIERNKRFEPAVVLHYRPGEWEDLLIN